MLIVRLKGVFNSEVHDRVRENIKQQISEGLIVHDDAIEITFADDMCLECGSIEYEEVKMSNQKGNALEHILNCVNCGHQRNLLK
ncbi:hypothetical protein D5F11_011410 [Siminovitchia terrae]|uniref:Uncharacterized protein n=1 Tax=Siminovitchia terrae TaxID=1914933 RepID=A0A429X8J4_SIMTE|nr:hypothetical protein [Siminovitchia terrae]RST59702.1 hypothetical protein D5F11_011410 [Siminovitchia terrae]